MCYSANNFNKHHKKHDTNEATNASQCREATKMKTQNANAKKKFANTCKCETKIATNGSKYK